MYNSVRRKKVVQKLVLSCMSLLKCETRVEKIIVWVTEVKRDITEEERMDLSLR